MSVLTDLARARYEAVRVPGSPTWEALDPWTRLQYADLVLKTAEQQLVPEIDAWLENR